MEDLGRGLGVLVAIAIFFLILLAILWTLLPFAIFGTKPKLDEIKAEIRATNARLDVLAKLLRQDSTPAHEPKPDGRVEPRL